MKLISPFGQILNASSSHPRLLTVLGRIIAGIALWMVVISLGTAFYGGSQGRRMQAIAEETAIYGFALAFASAVSVTLTLAIAGKKRLAVQAGISFICLIVLLATVAFVLVWLSPFMFRSRMSYWEVLQLREDIVSFAGAVAKLPAPLGVALGLFSGLCAGLLVALGRRWPRFAACLALGMLLLSVSSPVQRAVFSRLTDFILEWRRDHGPWSVSWVQAKELSSVLGGTFGAIVGAVCGAAAGWKRTGRLTRQFSRNLLEPRN